MNQINGILFDDNFVIYAPGRFIKNQNNLQITFTDGSTVDLVTGIVMDTQLETDRALVIIKLLPGQNTFSFGSLNNTPVTREWSTKKIKLNYRGAIEVLPSLNENITVEENEHCYASLNNGQVEITMAEFTEVTIFKSQDNNVNFSNIGGVKSSELPILRIWAPADTSIFGEAKTLKFTELAIVDLKCGEITGFKSQKIILDNMASTKVSCPIITEELNIKSMGDISLGTTLNTKNLRINTSSTVSSAFEIKTTTAFIKTMGKVDLKHLSATDAKIETSGKVEIESGATAKLIIVTMGSITLENLNGDDIKIDTSGEVTLKSGIIKNLHIKTMGEVKIDCAEINNLYVNTSSSVNVEIATGATDTIVKTMGRVDLILATANTTNVNTMGQVKVQAYKFLTEPKIKTMGKEKISIRN